MPAEREELRDELLAAVRARRELSKEDEEYLVGAFLDRLDGEIDRRIDEKMRAAIPKSPAKRGLGQDMWVVPAALGIAIPLTAVAGAAAGLPGVIVAWIAIVLVVLAATQGHD